MDKAEARAFADFLLPMLEPEPALRASAAEMLLHPWLSDNFDPVAFSECLDDVEESMRLAREAEGAEAGDSAAEAAAVGGGEGDADSGGSEHSDYEVIEG